MPWPRSSARPRSCRPRSSRSAKAVRSWAVPTQGWPQGSGTSRTSSKRQSFPKHLSKENCSTCARPAWPMVSGRRRTRTSGENGSRGRTSRRMRPALGQAAPGIALGRRTSPSQRPDYTLPSHPCWCRQPNARRTSRSALRRWRARSGMSGSASRRPSATAPCWPGAGTKRCSHWRRRSAPRPPWRLGWLPWSVRCSETARAVRRRERRRPRQRASRVGRMRPRRRQERVKRRRRSSGAATSCGWSLPRWRGAATWPWRLRPRPSGRRPPWKPDWPPWSLVSRTGTPGWQPCGLSSTHPRSRMSCLQQ
mmetsp:Transcript_19016/g.52376  ORF Transcript_19016/g.52376 Transcript_19016/m.52376 type:complete len:308 (-) Transcript_19016:2735-3658(-)